jgi:hypothetical protein
MTQFVAASPSPCPLPIRWGEGGRRPGEGLEATLLAGGHVFPLSHAEALPSEAESAINSSHEPHGPRPPTAEEADLGREGFVASAAGSAIRRLQISPATPVRGLLPRFLLRGGEDGSGSRRRRAWASRAAGARCGTRPSSGGSLNSREADLERAAAARTGSGAEHDLVVAAEAGAPSRKRETGSAGDFADFGS